MTHDNDYMYFDPATIGAIVAGLGSAGVQAVDASKKRKIEAGLATLNAQEQKICKKKRSEPKRNKPSCNLLKTQSLKSVERNTFHITSVVLYW